MAEMANFLYEIGEISGDAIFVDKVIPEVTMGKNTEDAWAVPIAEQAAFITAGIPGPKAAATKVANLAVNMIDFSF